ncbi:hypothetical protein [Mycolicibacterium stellerae]|nr:hypothetical protein [Mycolicibacterium stellerae]
MTSSDGSAPAASISSPAAMTRHAESAHRRLGKQHKARARVGCPRV